MEGKYIIHQNMEKLHSTLNALRGLKSSIRNCFEHLSEGDKNQQDEDENHQRTFLFDFQENYNTINTKLRDLEALINNLQGQHAPYYLGNTMYLAQEIFQDRQALYQQLVNSYKWIDKVHDHSSLASNKFTQNNLKRSYSYCSQKRGRIPSSCNNPDPEHIEKLFAEINLQHAGVTHKVSRPFGSNAVVTVTIGRVLKAAVVCKGVLIEWVTVRGFDEPMEADDLWAESRYEVFRKIQEHTHIAMLHFFSPALPDVAIKSYMTWLNSYYKLYVDPCKRCGRYLCKGLPPTWRDLRTLEPFHEDCKNS